MFQPTGNTVFHRLAVNNAMLHPIGEVIIDHDAID